MTALHDVCCACLPASALPHLAPLRTLTALRCRLKDDRLWLSWEAGNEEILQRLLPLHGVELFARHDGLWYRAGQRLPVFTVPSLEDGGPLAGLVAPERIQPEQHGERSFSPQALCLVREEQPRPATALVCSLEELARWADLATSRELSGLTGAFRDGQALVVGQHLPATAEGQRYWGRTILVPLGYRPEPALPEHLLCEALALTADDLALLHPEGVEILPRVALTPLTRAGIRLALRE